VVPVIDNDQIDPAHVQALAAAVRAGTGFAGYHGGLAASFQGAVQFHDRTGVHWMAHPGNMAAHYRVHVTKPDDPILQGIGISTDSPSDTSSSTTPRSTCSLGVNSQASMTR